MTRKFHTVLFAVFALAAIFVAPPVGAQTSIGSFSAPRLITEAITSTRLVTLSGNRRPEANAQNDRGAVPDSFAMPHLLLQLKRSPTQEQALEGLIDQLHDPASAQFHQWLSPAQFGAAFGLASSDINQISNWLTGQGFQLNQVYPSGMLIDFSGTAGQVNAAFHTSIHNLLVNGVAHFANMTDPQIPAALAPAVIGIVSLHDFAPKPALVRGSSAASSGPLPATTYGNPPTYAVTPPDLETIYNINPLFSGGVTGQGQTIYLIEPTDLYTNNDWTTFRSAFGLAGYTSASLNTIHPGNCADPGYVADDGDEAILDAEYAGASAPGANIVMVSCGGTYPGDIMMAIQNLINGTYSPAVISMSYIECEAEAGASTNAAFNAAFQQGVAEGASIFVSAGDQSAAACDFQVLARHGIAVNGLASTPYNVAVGGTDFGDTYAGADSTYWNSTNTVAYGSAKSYIPEIPWNTTCAGQLAATYHGYTTTYGASGLCNISGLGHLFGPGGLKDWGGSGGPSGCATGTPSISSVVSGTCAGYAKPSWQSGIVGVPNDGVRDLPDVSLFASFGPWNHGYIICWSDTANGGNACTGAPSTWSTDYGGTSFASPIMAGVQALVNQETAQRWGNPNYAYYRLAGAEYGAKGNSACNSSLGTATASTCIFYDVTLGDNDAPCAPDIDQNTTYNCYLPSGTYGVLSTSSTSYAPAFSAGTGWDFATGLGSVNVYNLVMNWTGSGTPPTSPLVAAVLPASRSAVVNAPVTAFATIINTGNSTAPGCSIAAPGDLPASFAYQPTNPSTNALTGTANTPVSIAGGAAQSFVIALTPNLAFPPLQVPFSFACTNIVSAPSETGLNTLAFSASATPVPDVVALIATASNDGILHIIGTSGANSFAVATVNLGASSPITASLNTASAMLPLALTLCQTQPNSGQCISPTGATVSTTINANTTPTFAVFGTASGAIPFDPVNNRVFLQFVDSTGAVRGETSVAVETQ